MINKKIALVMALTTLAFNFTGCGNKNKSSDESVSSEQSVTDSAESPTEETEEVVSEEDINIEEDTTTEELISNENATGMTNQQFLRLVNDKFGFYSDESFEGDVEAAKLWNVIDDDLEIDADSSITPEFLISVVMKATNYVDENAEINAILDCAVQYKVIEKADISSVDVNKAEEIINAANNAWLYPNMYQ